MEYFNPELFFLAISSISSAILGVWVYKNNPKSATNRLFGVLGMVVSLWVITMYLAQAPRFLAKSLFLTRMTIFFAAPMNMLFFLLAETLPDNNLKTNKKLLGFLWVVTILIMGLSLSPLIFADVVITDGVPSPIPGPALALFGLVSVSLNISAVYVLARRLRASEGLIREQLRIVMLGIMLMFGLIIFAIFIPVLMYGNASFVPLAPAFTLVFLAMTAYAIIHHGFLDIKFIVARTVSFIFINFFLALAVGFIVFSFLRSAPDILPGNYLYAMSLFALAIAILSFQHIERWVTILSNKIFFKKDYDSEVLLDQLTRIMVSTIDLDKLTQGILKKLTGEMNITKGVFVVFDNHKISEVSGIGYSENKIKMVDLDILFHTNLSSRRLVFEEMEESPLKGLFRELDISLAYPIAVEKKDIAILLLGRKLSGDIYFDHDLKLLDLFSREAGIAIQNSRTYREVKSLNKELEARVKARTRDLKESQERELLKARSVAKLKDEFVFVAAHELRAPITAIRGFLELVSETNNKMPKDMAANLEEIHYASDHLNHLVNDLLEVARSEADAMPIEMSSVDIRVLMDETLKELSPVAKKSKIKFKNELVSSVSVLADKSKIKEVFTNLISNGIKYNKDGGEIFIQAVTVPEVDRVFIEIRDTGYGIPVDQQDKIFGKFFRASTEQSGKVLGTGLGLFITRMLIQKMGGDISFSSIPDGGTTFSFYLKKA